MLSSTGYPFVNKEVLRRTSPRVGCVKNTSGRAVNLLTESESGARVETGDGAEYDGDIVIGADGPDGVVGMALVEGDGDPRGM